MGTVINTYRLSKKDDEYMEKNHLDSRKIIENFIMDHRKNHVEALQDEKKDCLRIIQEKHDRIAQIEGIIKEKQSKCNTPCNTPTYKIPKPAINRKAIAEERKRRHKGGK